MSKKISIVIKDGSVEEIFTDIEEQVDIELINFDNVFSFSEKQTLLKHVNNLREESEQDSAS